MLDRVISGGQTGADQAGWRAARASGLATGGWMPLGFLTEAGPRPEFAGLYGATEMPTADDVARTWQNASESTASLWFGRLDAPGSWTTHRAASDHGRSILDVTGRIGPADVARWLRMNGFRTLNVAGDRESGGRGIGARVERFMLAVFRQVVGG
jgi:Circularly permutated YpsA SLOG family